MIIIKLVNGLIIINKENPQRKKLTATVKWLKLRIYKLLIINHIKNSEI